MRPRQAGAPGLKIPPFSLAIDSGDPPSHSVWSRLIGVIAVPAGRSTFVASSRPPRPVSTTATSTPHSAKQVKASAVANSKYVQCSAVSQSSTRAAAD